MRRVALIACVALAASGCAGARQFLHNGLTYATGSDQQGELRSRMSGDEWRQYQSESQNLASAEQSRRFD